MAEQPGYEERDVNVRSLWIFAAGLTVSVIVVIFLISGMMDYLTRHFADIPTSALAPPSLAPQPVLQTNPPVDLRRYEDEQERILSTYGWVDREAGTVHIPIERAMQLMVERGVNSGISPDSATPVEMRQQRALEGDR
jgi:hypothetical protein